MNVFFQSSGSVGIKDAGAEALVILVQSGGSDYSKGPASSKSIDVDFWCLVL